MRVLVTGAAGFLGSWLAEGLLKQGHDVRGVDSLLGGYRENVPEEVVFRVADCCDLEAMSVMSQGCDLVVHAAASAYEGFSVFSPALVTKNIYLASVTMISAAARAKVPRFLMMSSMSRYGDNQVPFTEDMEPRPRDPYAVAKVASEQVLKMLGPVHGLKYVIAVPHNIFGPRQKFDDPFRNFVSIFINQMLRGKRQVIYGDGEQRRCITYIKDVVPPLLKLCEPGAFDGETFNIGPDSPFVTVNQVARTIARLVGVEFDPVYHPDRPLEVRDANCSADKARRLLDYRPTYSLEDALKESIEWVRPRARPFSYHLEVEIQNERTPRTWTEKLFD